MMNYPTMWLAIALISASAHGQSTSSSPTPDSAPPACPHDRDQLLSLDEPAFDQDISNGGGGWRAVAALPGCEPVAADLLRDYRRTHPTASTPLIWHEAQMRAYAGQTDQAVALMDLSKKPANRDPAGWNLYVDATRAFLTGDRRALEAARAQLARVPPSPDLPPVVDGYIEMRFNNDQTIKMRWPPNLDVIDGLIRCFGKPYALAYDNSDCRNPTP